MFFPCIFPCKLTLRFSQERVLKLKSWRKQTSLKIQFYYINRLKQHKNPKKLHMTRSNVQASKNILLVCFFCLVCLFVSCLFPSVILSVLAAPPPWSGATVSKKVQYTTRTMLPPHPARQPLAPRSKIETRRGQAWKVVILDFTPSGLSLFNQSQQRWCSSWPAGKPLEF